MDIGEIQICDGGTGFASILTKEIGGEIIFTKSTNPISQPISSYYGYSSKNKEVFIEVANTSGLALLEPKDRNPIKTTSYGVGIQVVDAIRNYQPSKIYIGCGDTAINDFGIGFLSAIGVEFKNKNGNYFFPKTPLDVLNISYIDSSKSRYVKYLRENCQVIVCCNLSSQLGGTKGTTDIYARQKGASDKDIIILNKAKEHYLDLTKEKFGIDASLIPGSGAAGGLGASLNLFCNGLLSYSFEFIFDLIKLETRIIDYNLVITGEGLLDQNSLKGKAPIGVALKAKKHNIKVGLIAGAVAQYCTNVLHRAGIDYVETLTHPQLQLDYYIKKAPDLIADASFRLMQKIM